MAEAMSSASSIGASQSSHPSHTTQNIKIEDTDTNSGSHGQLTPSLPAAGVPPGLVFPSTRSHNQHHGVMMPLAAAPFVLPGAVGSSAASTSPPLPGVPITVTTSSHPDPLKGVQHGLRSTSSSLTSSAPGTSLQYIDHGTVPTSHAEHNQMHAEKPGIVNTNSQGLQLSVGTRTSSNQCGNGDGNGVFLIPVVNGQSSTGVTPPNGVVMPPTVSTATDQQQRLAMFPVAPTVQNDASAQTNAPSGLALPSPKMITIQGPNGPQQVFIMQAPGSMVNSRGARANQPIAPLNSVGNLAASSTPGPAVLLPRPSSETAPVNPAPSTDTSSVNNSSNGRLSGNRRRRSTGTPSTLRVEIAAAPLPPAVGTVVEERALTKMSKSAPELGTSSQQTAVGGPNEQLAVPSKSPDVHPHKYKKVVGGKSPVEVSSVPTVSPQTFLDTMILGRGYSTQYFCSLEGGYYCKPTSLQKASYGNRVVQAVRSSDADLLHRLLQSGLSRNPCNAFGESVVHMVCRRGDYKLLKVLVDNGCSVQVADDFGRTPLHDACWTSEPCFQCVELILDIDERLLHVVDCRGSPPLAYVKKENWQQWIDFFNSKKECYWANRDVSKVGDEAPPRLCTQPAHSNPIKDPQDALPMEVVPLVANGKLDPEDAKRNAGKDTESQASKGALMASDPSVAAAGRITNGSSAGHIVSTA